MLRVTPDVTVIVIDTVAHELARLAVEDTLRQIAPGDVLVFSDRSLGGHFVRTEARSLEDVARVLWYEVPKFVRTSHFLVVQWDGWVLDGAAWDEGWLGVDYLGAPWPWHRDGHVVGNGGFSLRSADLTRWVAANPGRYPVQPAEDDALCRAHRPALERDGFVWGSRAQAQQFAFEREPPHPTFGYHGIWHWPRVLGPERLAERIELASDYARGKPEWRELLAAMRPSS